MCIQRDCGENTVTISGGKDMKHENEEITRLIQKLNEFYVFTLQSVRHILNSSSVDKVTHCVNNNTSEKAASEAFIDTLYSSCNRLFSKNHRTFGNFVLTGKQGFNILKSYKSPRLVFDERFGIIDSLIKVYYIPSMEENRFIVSVCEPIDFDNHKDYEIYYNLSKSDKNYFQNMDAMIVGEIVDCESSN